MLSAVPLWLHILAATIWVGSQVMMFAVVVPSLRRAEHAPSRIEVLRGVTSRFGYLGIGALVLLILTGIDNIARYSPDDMFDFRYGYILAVKIAMLVFVLGLTVVHTLSVGPRLLDLQAREAYADAVPAGDALRRLRKQSILISSLTLLLSVAILFCAALLRSTFAFRLV